MATVRGVVSEYSFPVFCVRFPPERSDHFFASGACGNIFLCQMRTGKYEVHINEEHNEINNIDINSSNQLASGGKDAVIRIYDLLTAKLLARYPKGQLLKEDLHTYHRMRIFATKFHPLQKDMLLSGGWDNHVKIWDIRLKDGFAREIIGPHICGEAIDIRDKEVLTGSWTVRNSIQLWDFGSGKLIDSILPYNHPRAIDGEFLYCIQYLKADNTGDAIVCGGSGSDLVEVISLSERKVLSHFKVKKTVLALDTFQNLLVFGGMHRTVNITEYTGRNPAVWKTLV